MIKIGKREVLESFPQLQIPAGEEAEIDINVYGWNLKIIISFNDTTSEQAIQIRAVDNNSVRLIFEGWSNSIGTALKSPAKLAKLQAGGTLEFMATNYRVGTTTNLFSLQLLHNKEGI